MNYQREWVDPRNAAGFAAACARLALPFYKGDYKSKLADSIEVAERYADGGEIDEGIAKGTARSAHSVAYDGETSDSYAAANAAARAGYTATKDTDLFGDVSTVVSHAIGIAGIDVYELQITYARWVVRDLGGTRELSAELRQAAGAAVVAGDEALARELLA